MPLDGTDYQPEQSLEERALRYADDFFTGPEKWHRGDCWNDERTKLCVGAALLQCVGDILLDTDPDRWDWMSRTLGISGAVATFNDKDCPDFAALKAHLHTRIEYYTEQRLKHSYIVVIGPGRKVKL